MQMTLAEGKMNVYSLGSLEMGISHLSPSCLYTSSSPKEGTPLNLISFQHISWSTFVCIVPLVLFQPEGQWQSMVQGLAHKKEV